MRTTASTFGIWVIVAVAMLCLAAWLISVYVADSQQARASRLRRQLDARGPVLNEAAAPAASIPGQRREAGRPEPENVEASRGRHAKPGADYAVANGTETDGPETVGHQKDGHQTDGLRTDFRTDGPLTDVETDAPTRSGRPAQADAPTRPDLPAQQPAPTGRHAMPTQRTGDSDRAERTYAGPDANTQDDQDQR